MIIRKATADDIAAMVPLWRELADQHMAMSPLFAINEHAEESFAKHLLSLLDNENFYIPVAEIDGEIAGYVMASYSLLPEVFIMRKKVNLQDMMVKRSFRRKGVARKLVEAVREFARERNADRIDLQVAIKNEEAYQFWKAVGFEPLMQHLSMKP